MEATDIGRIMNINKTDKIDQEDQRANNQENTKEADPETNVIDNILKEILGREDIQKKGDKRVVKMKGIIE